LPKLVCFRKSEIGFGDIARKRAGGGSWLGLLRREKIGATNVGSTKVLHPIVLVFNKLKFPSTRLFFFNLRLDGKARPSIRAPPQI
jgi:hypothetical protein